MTFKTHGKTLPWAVTSSVANNWLRGCIVISLVKAYPTTAMIGNCFCTRLFRIDCRRFRTVSSSVLMSFSRFRRFNFCGSVNLARVTWHKTKLKSQFQFSATTGLSCQLSRFWCRPYCHCICGARLFPTSTISASCSDICTYCTTHSWSTARPIYF